MKKTKNKGLRRAINFILLLALVAGLAAMPLLTADKAPEEEFPLSILCAKAEQREIGSWLSAGGVLAEEETLSVTVPSDVKLTEFLVRNGDTVRAGDPVASVDRVTVMAAIASTQETMEDLAAQLEKERTGSSTDTVTAPGGVVKKVYAEAGDKAEDVMLEHGALAVISLDGRMAVRLEMESGLRGGDKLTARIGDETLDALVKSNLEGVLTVTFPDKGFEEGTSVTLAASDGTVLGTGECFIHAPWNAVAYSGTVSYVNVTEGRTLHEGGTVLGLKDIPYSAEYRSLAAQHRAYEEQLLELFTLYQTLTLTAPGDGVVSGIDEKSAQLLRSREGWKITLLANAPGEDPDAEYINFVGQVTQAGTDGYIMRLNPSFISVTDYTDLSAVPRDTAAMTYEAVYAGGAPVYRWNGESWVESSFAVGDILLFAGDATGRIVWVIPIGSGDLPGETPSEPTDPSDPSDPSDPTDPTDPENPTDPSDPTAPSVPDDPTVPTEPEGDGGSGGWPGGGLGGLGGITIPSFGGYSGYTGATTQEDQSYTVPKVTVALVTPQETMTVPVTVDELDLGSVSLGQNVDVTVEALPGRTFSGTVTAIGSIGTNLGGSSKFTVTVTLPREADMLAGMNASVTIALGTREGIALPVAALTQREGKLLVYTARDPETGAPANPREVTAGYSDGEYVLVEGISEGTEVWYTYYEALED